MKNEARITQDELYELRLSIFEGNAQKAKEVTEQALRLGLSIDSVITKGLFPPMKEIGDQLRTGEIFIPEVLMSARAIQAAMHAMQPIMNQGQIPFLGTVVIGTVAGDLHDIGKNLVAMVLRAKGFSVVDLGIDVTAEVFVEAIKRHNPDIVACSSLLTTTMPELKTIIEAITEEGLRSQVTIMVGGAPVTRDYAREISADIYAETLFEAGEAAEELMKHRISRFTV